MREINVRKSRISTAVTVIDESADADVDAQLLVVDSWAKEIPRRVVLSSVKPLDSNGMRWVNTGRNPPLRNALGAYMGGIPGRDIMILAAPDVIIGGDRQGLVSAMDRMMIDTWAAWCPRIDGNGPPVAFIASSSVIPHLMADMPATLLMGKEWQAWVDAWMKKSLPIHRYISASQYKIASEIPRKKAPEGVPAMIEAVKEAKATAGKKLIAFSSKVGTELLSYISPNK